MIVMYYTVNSDTLYRNYHKFPQIFLIFAQPLNQTQQITIQCYLTH